MTRRASSQTLTDHEAIRRWAEKRDAWPACVRRTRGRKDVGMIRLDFPGYSGAGSLQEISWDEWFEKFDDTNLALIVQNQTASGEKSNFNKIVGRDTVRGRARTRRRRRAVGHARAGGARARGRRRTSARRRSSQTALRARRGRAAWTSSATRTAKTVRSKRGRSARGRRSSSRPGRARVVAISSGRSRRTPAKTAKKRTSARTGQSRRRAA